MRIDPRVRQVAATAKTRADRVGAFVGAFVRRYALRTVLIAVAMTAVIVFLRAITPMLVGEQEPRHEVIAGDPATTALVVMTHGLAQGFRDLRPLAEIVRKSEGPYKGADVLLYAYDVRVFSNFSPEAAAAEMRNVIHDQVAARVAAGRPYTNIALVGHSVGGLVTRQAYLYGLGEPESGVYARRPPDDWARNVRRIVLLGTPNRGVEISRQRFVWRACNAIASLFGFGQLIQSAYRGSPFIVNLRLAWIDIFHDRFFADNAIEQPIIVQVLGTRDGLVKRSDSFDLAQMPKFASVTVPGATHAEIADMTRNYSRTKFLEALRTTELVAFEREPETSPARVVFLVHGIRDYGEWLSRLEEQLRRREPSVHVETDSIGYFTISNFLSPRARLQKVRWFADQYAEMRARYHHAPIEFAGHSFGTYILGDALRTYDRVRIDRAYLAGSVLPRNYDWESVNRAHQIREVLHDVAEDDIPVGVLARFLSQFFDCGSAGVNGFVESLPGVLMERKYFVGGHAAALFNQNFETIAAFLTTGAFPPPLSKPAVPAAHRTEARIVDDRGARWVLLTNFAVPLGWLVVFGAIAAPIVLARRHHGNLAMAVVMCYVLLYLYF